MSFVDFIVFVGFFSTGRKVYVLNLGLAIFVQMTFHQYHDWINHENTERKGSTLALKSRVDVTKSPKQGYQGPHEKDLRPQKF